MRKLCAALILCVGLVSAGVQAQNPPNPPTFTLASLDAPSEGAVIPAGQLTLAGWADYCPSGAVPSDVQVTLYDSAGTPHATSIAVLTGYSRPDVNAAYHTLCPATTDTSTGYVILLGPQPPPGTWQIEVRFNETVLPRRTVVIQ